MGADTTASHLIFFIAATVIAVSASGILAGVVMDLSDKLDVRGRAFGEQLTTNIRIVNDPGSVPVDDDVVIYVKNTGQSTLDASLATMILNGVACAGEDFDYEVLADGDPTAWRPGDVAVLTCDRDLDPGDHQVRVITANGVYDDMKFRID